MHNISTARSASPDDEFDNDGIPSTSREAYHEWRHPVLEVADGSGRSVRFMISEALGIVVNPWEEGRVVGIMGEDLYALRELMNELPEELFVRPADPVAEYTVLKDEDGDWWLEVEDEVFTPMVICGEAFVSSCLDGDLPQGRKVRLNQIRLFAEEPEPYGFAEGDLLIFRGEVAFSVRRRSKSGNWIVESASHVARPVSDAWVASALSANSGKHVLVRKPR